MKKLFLLIFSVLSLLLLTYKVSANSVTDNYPTKIEESISSNLLDPTYLVKDEDGTIHYDALIPYNTGDIYYLGIEGVETSENLTINVESSQSTGNTITRVKSIKLIFEFTFDLSGDTNSIQADENGYFRFYNLKCDALSDLSLDELKTKIYLNNDSMPRYHYTEYVSSKNYNNLDTSYSLITSVNNKLDLEALKKSFKIIHNDTATISLTSDGGYNDSYQTPGLYTVTYNLSSSNSSKDYKFNIYVFKEATPVINGDETIVIEMNCNQLEGFFTANDYFNSLFSMSYGGRTTSLNFTILDSDNKEYKLGDIYSHEGEYILRIDGIYNNEIVATKNVTLKIVNNQTPEIYFPTITVKITEISNYTDEELCELLKKTLALEGITASNVTIANTTYSSGAKAGVYDISYTYDVDGITYFATGNIEVSENSSNNANVIRIVSLSLIATIILTSTIIFVVIKFKHKKKIEK